MMRECQGDHPPVRLNSAHFTVPSVLQQNQSEMGGA